jgi:dihydrofolate reductase
MAQGDLTGYEFQVPIFVLTHHPPATTPKGQNDRLSVTFVTSGLQDAFDQAQAAAGDKDVTVIGGASTIQQCLRAGLADWLHVDVMPVLLGRGLPMFAHLEDLDITLERIQVTALPHGRTHMRFQIVK